ncbi:MAG: helix-turn-helix transcriptional regulator [Gemmatimonadota bacterium]|nr:helix-turn-helix transcriptional regulator [Gemmatimonadota bacterium]
MSYPNGDLLQPEMWEAVLEHLQLSGRLADVLQGAVAGATVGDIAAELGLSPHTVNSYLRQLYARLGVHGRVELAGVVFGTALRNGQA